jgi:serine acetyltransferase
LSKKERFGSAKLLGNKNLAYGEITYATLHKVVLWIEKHFECKIGENFFDLGHGTGKAIVAAAIIGSFKQISGVELLDGLYY